MHLIKGQSNSGGGGGGGGGTTVFALKIFKR